jgi:hypothetical protein
MRASTVSSSSLRNFNEGPERVGRIERIAGRSMSMQPALRDLSSSGATLMQTLYASIRPDRGAVSEKFGPNASRFKSMA